MNDLLGVNTGLLLGTIVLVLATLKLGRSPRSARSATTRALSRRKE